MHLEGRAVHLCSNIMGDLADYMCICVPIAPSDRHIYVLNIPFKTTMDIQISGAQCLISHTYTRMYALFDNRYRTHANSSHFSKKEKKKRKTFYVHTGLRPVCP